MKGAWLTLVATAACGDQGLPPIARIDLSPEALCEGHQEQGVIISGKRSEALDGGKVIYGWSFSRPPSEFLRGGTNEDELAVRFTGETPVAVRLQIEDAGGLQDERERVLALTRNAPSPCSDGCASHETCVSAGGRDLCAPAALCSEDSECGCLRCITTDTAERYCLPR